MIDCLYNCFKHWAQKGSVYIISDTHFDDEDCIKMSKDWISPKEQIAILKNIAHKNDTLIHLGDVGNTDYIKELKCYKVLIMGNHDTGHSKYKRQVFCQRFSKSEFSRDDAIKKMKESHPDCVCSVTSGHDFYEPFEYWEVEADNMLFDEVYDGPLMISEKILLSHEPIQNIDWCFNIHGHDHSNSSCDENHLNLAANVCGYTPISLGEYLKTHGLSKIKSLHRETIDTATKRKQKREKRH